MSALPLKVSACEVKCNFMKVRYLLNEHAAQSAEFVVANLDW